MNQRQITEKFNAKLPKIEIINLESKQSEEFSTHKNQQHNRIWMNGSRNVFVICLRQQRIILKNCSWLLGCIVMPWWLTMIVLQNSFLS